MEKANTWTVDAHCHWSDERVFADAEREIPIMIAKGIAAFQLGGVDPREWRRQQELQRKFPRRIFCAFGLHPYFVATSTREPLEQAWQDLSSLALAADALGEMGLDFRRHYLIAGREIQTEFFARQLQLAGKLEKPAVLHIVRAHEEALRELKTAPISGMVHAFTAGPKVACRYLDLGLHLSIGAKLLHPETADLADSVRAAPLDRLLVESDCPDQPPPGQSHHDSLTVWLILRRIAELKKLPFADVVEQTRANLFALLKKEFRP